MHFFVRPTPPARGCTKGRRRLLKGWANRRSRRGSPHRTLTRRSSGLLPPAVSAGGPVFLDPPRAGAEDENGAVCPVYPAPLEWGEVAQSPPAATVGFWHRVTR